MIQECIVLAGGLGTRLRSVVADKPKCMAPVNDHPFLHYLLQYLIKQGITHVVLSLGYKSEQVIEWCEQANLPLTLTYATEPEPLGTGGAILNAISHIKGNDCIVVNGDTFFDVSLADLHTFHQQTASNLTLALKPMSEFERYGSVQLDAQGRVTAFLEKQYCKEGLINGGVYLTSKAYLQSLGLPQQFSFEKEVLEPQVNNQQVFGFVSDTYFIDIGIPADYEQVQLDFRS
ncbi:nucleotidyltransferase family protein [Chitinophaga rhizophila]|uniref:Nucleotidyltransferase family protein n=1 Tax=Chitinophaga rhizophila TaxID=2866212 RepID=A0ABS7GJ47_9BACT|nr:nucleotidyltransferase family protein [Chitinophaga rhizophila]MBW8687728.1 nucleotidyltransferase family protein [Chitinophaga rhizophila]